MAKISNRLGQQDTGYDERGHVGWSKALAICLLRDIRKNVGRPTARWVDDNSIKKTADT